MADAVGGRVPVERDKAGEVEGARAHGAMGSSWTLYHGEGRPLEHSSSGVPCSN